MTQTTLQNNTQDADFFDFAVMIIAFVTYPPITVPLALVIYFIRWSPLVQPIIIGSVYLAKGEISSKQLALTALPALTDGLERANRTQQLRLEQEEAQRVEMERLQRLEQQQEQHFAYLRQERLAITTNQTIVEFLADGLRVLFTGPTGSGKSLLLWHTGHYLHEKGFEVHVIDLKADKFGKKWPYASTVSGYGYGHIAEAYDDIEAKLVWWNKLMGYRGEQQAHHQGKFPPALLVIDEANILATGSNSTESCINAYQTALDYTLRMGRELNMNIMVAAQDDLVETLGLEGKSALLRNFALRCEVVKVSDRKRKAIVMNGHKKPIANFDVPKLSDPTDVFNAPPLPDNQSDSIDNQIRKITDNQATQADNQTDKIADNQPNGTSDRLNLPDYQASYGFSDAVDNQPKGVNQMVQDCQATIDTWLSEGRHISEISARKIALYLRENNPAVNELAARWVAGELLKKLQCGGEVVDDAKA